MPSTWPSDPAKLLLARLVANLEHQLPHAQGLRRELHRHPDLSGFERPTAERMRHALPNLRATRVADTGFLVRVGPPGPAIAIRAELDALPVVERTGVEWASTSSAMHACGHDVHMAALWALLQAARHIEDLPVGLVGLFQPREETQPSGAEDVVTSQLLTEHEVRAVVGAHVQPRVPSGVISTGAGAVNAAADQFDIVVHGQPGHGAYPHVAVDPVPILASIVLGLQELVGRTIDPIHPAVITVGHMEAGTAHNIIPETGSLHGVIRTMYESDRTHLHAAIRRLAEHTAAARGAHADVNLLVGDPVLDNDRRLVQLVDPLLGHLGLPVAHEPFRSCGADDFSHYSRIAPILMMFVGTGGPSSGARHRVGLHHPTFLPGEESIRHMALALTAGFVLEEGLPMDELRLVAASMARAAERAGVMVAAGDTKVVEHGTCDGLYVTTAGIGLVDVRADLDPARVRPGDKVLLSGTLADHGVAVMIARGGLRLEATIESDTAPLNELAALLLPLEGALRFMRDPTRGGLATTLNELAAAAGCGVVLEEAALPVRPEVAAACEILGIDPLYVANEGKLVAVVSPAAADSALAALRAHPLGRAAAIVGEVAAEPAGLVVLETTFGGRRVVDMLVGDPLPRIC